jgi:hypothetical protein
MSQTISADVIGKLREALVNLKKTAIYRDIVEPKDGVLARFQPIFSVEHVPEITEEEFWSFLLLENNHHWTGLNRHGTRMCSDMSRLRKGLSVLLDDDRPVAERLDEAIGMISGMGKNLATSILLITHPDRYGVWNNRSEAVMAGLGIWPELIRGRSFGNLYAAVNQILLQLRDGLQIDLWTLDALWWFLDKEQSPVVLGTPGVPDQPVTTEQSEQLFGLERHLHEFLRDNWKHVELGKEWALYSRPGDEEAGYEFPCDVGRIDLLAKHKTKPRWLVVELKRNQTSDQTVGQLLRYVGWVKRHLAEENDEVHGLIICHEADDTLHYAMSVVPNVKLLFYEVEFHLKEPKGIMSEYRHTNPI